MDNNGQKTEGAIESQQRNKGVLTTLFDGLWEGFKTVLAWLFVIYLVLFVVVGGEFHIRVKWENVAELWRIINGR